MWLYTYSRFTDNLLATLLIHFVMARLFKVQFTRSITSPPEYIEISAETREQARDIFYGMNPTYFVTAVF